MNISIQDKSDLNLQNFNTEYTKDLCLLRIEINDTLIRIEGNYTEICVLESFFFKLIKTIQDKRIE